MMMGGGRDASLALEPGEGWIIPTVFSLGNPDAVSLFLSSHPKYIVSLSLILTVQP